MPHVLALMTSDAALVGCELDRVRSHLTIEPGAVVGVGGWQDGQVVERRYASPSDDAWEAPDSEVVLLASRRLGPGEGIEDSAQPFRFRQWLFSAAGALERGPVLRERLREELPEFLAATLRGPTWEETAFATFLSQLRSLGRLEDETLDPAAAARCLAASARALEQVSGSPPRGGFGFVASNGKVLVATRRGPLPLSYSLLEGQADCARHPRPSGASEADAGVRDHRRRRSVVLASGVPPGAGWVELADGATLAVDRRLSVTIASRPG